MTDEEINAKGYHLYTVTLAKLDGGWLYCILKKGKIAWLTGPTVGGFNNHPDARKAGEIKMKEIFDKK